MREKINGRRGSVKIRRAAARPSPHSGVRQLQSTAARGTDGASVSKAFRMRNSMGASAGAGRATLTNRSVDTSVHWPALALALGQATLTNPDPRTRRHVLPALTLALPAFALALPALHMSPPRARGRRCNSSRQCSTWGAHPSNGEAGLGQALLPSRHQQGHCSASFSHLRSWCPWKASLKCLTVGLTRASCGRESA